MKYKKRTEHYSIPYLTDGEKVDYAEEEKKMRMIDSLLFAGNCGVAKALFDDGTYEFRKVTDDNYKLIVIPSPNYSVIGIVNYRLFCSSETIEFTDLKKGGYYFIYVSYTLSLESESHRFLKTITRDKKPDTINDIILAEVDFTGDVPMVIENPPDKTYSTEILAHTSDSHNPHGIRLIQSIMEITDTLKLKGAIVYKAKYIAGTFAGDGKSTVIDLDFKPIHANVTPLQKGYGEYWVQINDKSIDVYNSGASVGFEIEIMGE